MRSIGPAIAPTFCLTRRASVSAASTRQLGIGNEDSSSTLDSTLQGVCLEVPEARGGLRCRRHLSARRHRHGDRGAGLGARPTRRPSTRVCRPSPRARSAPRTSSSSTASNNVYIGQAAHCSGTGGGDRDERLRLRLAPERHAGRGRRRQPARHDGLQLVARHAGEGRDQRRTPAGATTSRSSSSTRPTRRRSTRRSRSGAARTASPTRPRPARRSCRTATRRCAWRHRAQPEGGQVARQRGRERRLDAPGLHRDARASPATRAARSSTATARRSAC